MVRSILGIAAFTAAAAASGQTAPPTGTPLQQGSIDRTTQTEDVHFRNDDQDRMTVPVQLAGSSTYQFLVDTAADRSAISRAIVQKFNFSPASKAELHSLTGVSNVTTARVPSIAVTRKLDSNVEAAVLDSANMGADGIVGSDLLMGQRVEFDFANRTMSVVPSSAPDIAEEPGSIVIRAKRKNGRLIVTDAEAAGQRTTMVLDTGAEISIGNEALHRRLLASGASDAGHDFKLYSVTGSMISGDYMVIPKLTAGGVTIANVPVVFVDAHTFKQLKLDQKPALLLGMSAIRAFKKVSIDFANRSFRVVLPEHSALETRLAFAG
ncbi:MAG TPA: retroviral-like aspartic protease family protein [Sphingomicrobium sp.]|jgi:predicted aspartyl protease